MVVSAASDNGFSGYLASAAEEAFRNELFAIGPPIVFEFAPTCESLPDFPNAVPLIAAEVLGNVRYKLAIRVPWAKGKQHTEIIAKLNVIKGNIFPKMVTTLRFIIRFRFRFRFGCGRVACGWLAGGGGFAERRTGRIPGRKPPGWPAAAMSLFHLRPFETSLAGST